MTVANDPIADICGAVAAREADLLRPADHNQAMAKRWVIEASRLAHKLKDYLEVASKSTQAYVASRIRTLADDRFLRRSVPHPSRQALVSLSNPHTLV